MKNSLQVHMMKRERDEVLIQGPSKKLFNLSSMFIPKSNETLNICNRLNQEDTTIQSVSWRSSLMKDGLHRRRCTDSEEKRQESLCDCFSVCDNDVLVCACSQVPIKVNKTNCYVSICGCFSSCCKFRRCTVYPTLFLVHVLVCVCARVGRFDCVFFSSSATLPLSWSMPGSEVITTELLCHSLMWFATQMRAHRHTHTDTQAYKPRSIQDKQNLHLRPCASVCSHSRR